MDKAKVSRPPVTDIETGERLLRADEAIASRRGVSTETDSTSKTDAEIKVPAEHHQPPAMQLLQLLVLLLLLLRRIECSASEQQQEAVM